MKRTPFKKTFKATGEMELFKKIWEAMPHPKMSDLDDSPLPFKPGEDGFASQFSHLLPKGAYPKQRLMAENIMVVTPSQHDEWSYVKEKSEAWLEYNNYSEWIPWVEKFRALRLKANT